MSNWNVTIRATVTKTLRFDGLTEGEAIELARRNAAIRRERRNQEGE
jgi:hypothetical protein